MRKLSLGAASVTVLLLATAACGNTDNATQSSEVEAAADEDADGAAYNDDKTASDSDRASGSYADARTADTYDAAASQYQTVAADMSRSEIETLAARAFESADIDDDGVLNRNEYVQMTLASARDFDTFATEPVKLMSVSPVTNPEAMTTETIGVTLDADQVAEIQTAAGENFDEAAGGNDTLTSEELRASFLARFEEADQDGDDELNAAELRTFAALTRGE